VSGRVPRTHNEPRFLAPQSAGSQTASGAQHERKHITVLFADIAGSTELVADLDPDDARRLLDPILDRMVAAVQLYEGTVHRLMGDGIMALFGAPVAYEDHALRACYSALRMQESIRKYAEELRRSEGISLQIRVGLNSGEVTAGARGGDEGMTYSVNGQPVHLAARMEQLAIPGTILITFETCRLTNGFLATRPLGPMVVKGLSEPVETYELLGANAVHSRLQAAASKGLTRFVGRLHELSQLRNAREQAQAGRGRLVAIVGEPGVGKSRLIHEFVRAEFASGWRILEAGAGSVSYATGTNFFPVTEFLRGFFRIATSDDVAEVREKVTSKLLSLDKTLLSALPALLAMMDMPQEESRSSRLVPSQRGRSAVEAMKQLLYRESEVQPLVVILEDLHTIDPDTHALLDAVMDSLPAVRILLIVSYRPEYRDAWSDRAYCTQIRIDPLDMPDANALLDGLMGTDGVLEPLKRLLIERTTGNPFFLEESVRALVETGVLVGRRGGYTVTQAVSQLDVPATVESLVASRIDRLRHSDKRLLLSASVIGYQVPLDVLQAVAELAPEELRQAMERLQTSEFLHETSLFPQVEYTFRHALVHEVAYRSLSLDRRRATHTAALVAGERLYSDQTFEKAEWLAFHAFRGQVWDRAVPHFRSAAARAIRRAASRIAVQHLEHALVAAGHVAKEERSELEVDLRIELRHALTPLGQVQRTLENLRTAEALAAAMGDRQRLGRIVSFTANCLVNLARHGEALETGARALAIARELRDPSLEIATRLYMARARLARAECRAAIEILHEVIEALNEKPADDFLGLPMLPAAAARSVLAVSLAEMGDFDAAAAQASEAANRAASSRQPDSIMWGNWSCGLVAMLRGAADEALGIFERLHELCRAHDLDAYTSRAMAGLGRAKARLGLVKEGLQLLETAVAMDASAEPKTTRSFALNALAEALFLGGENERALAACDQAFQFAREHEERGAEAHACFLLGLIHTVRTGDFETAAGYLQAAASIASDCGLRPLLAHCHLGLAQLHRERGDPAEGRDCLERGRGMLTALAMKQWFLIESGTASGSVSKRAP
jgi:predicted ATPase/class 3 adenylate cyclase